jgi:hypothetical protein
MGNTQQKDAPPPPTATAKKEKRGSALLFDAEWTAVCASLPGTGGGQDAKNRKQAEGVTFSAKVLPNFSKHFLANYDPKTTYGYEEMETALQQFASHFGGSAIKQVAEDMLPLLKQNEKSTKATCVVMIHIYTLQSFFFQQLNKSLRDDHEAYIQLVHPLTSTLVAGLGYYPFQGAVFRGFTLPDEEIPLYRAGLIFFWPGFTSCSKNESTAMEFANGGGILFEISVSPERRCIAGDVEMASYFKAEAEVLLAPYTSLYITSTSQNAGEPLRVCCNASSSTFTLTGVWECDDGGKYYISQVDGDNIFWFGQATGSSHFSFANVFFGKLADIDGTGVGVSGQYGDIPTGSDRYVGEITLQVSHTWSEMNITQSDGIFGGKHFKKLSSHVEDGQRPVLTARQVEEDAGKLTGCWISDRQLVYFVSEYPAVDGSKRFIFWFAHSTDWSAANVCWGKWNSGTESYDCIFSDIVLSSRFRYTGKITATVVSASELRLAVVHGAYACTAICKQ